jgi:hypothetical protein
VDRSGRRRRAAEIPDPRRARPRRRRGRARVPTRSEDVHLSHRLRRQGLGRHLPGAARVTHQHPPVRSRAERGAGPGHGRLGQQRRIRCRCCRPGRR